MLFGYQALTGFLLSVYELSMAEGVDNDMNQQQQQDGVPHGQEAFHSPSVHFESTVFDAANTPSIEVTVSSAQPGVNQGPKKKSAFQITSVTETRAHSRGDSNGYDEFAEDLNESDVTEIQIETIEDSTTGNGNGASRFKVVRIQNKEPYKRGRWHCRDFEQPTTSSTSSTYNADSREVQSTSTASSNFFTSNHVSSDASNAVDQSISNHKNMVEVTFNYKPGQTPSVAPANFEALRKRESEPHLASASLKSDHVDVATNKPLAPSERIEKIAEAARLQGIASQSEAAPAGDELPIVNTIASAMDKITEIKSALLTVVHEEVQTLKDTIKKLKEENEELKEENEKLKQIVDQQL